jgi:hypothetical protein
METRVVPEFSISELVGAPFPVILANAVKEKVCSSCGNVLIKAPVLLMQSKVVNWQLPTKKGSPSQLSGRAKEKSPINHF